MLIPDLALARSSGGSVRENYARRILFHWRPAACRFVGRAHDGIGLCLQARVIGEHAARVQALYMFLQLADWRPECLRTAAGTAPGWLRAWTTGSLPKSSGRGRTPSYSPVGMQQCLKPPS